MKTRPSSNSKAKKVSKKEVLAQILRIEKYRSILQKGLYFAVGFIGTIYLLSFHPYEFYRYSWSARWNHHDAGYGYGNQENKESMKFKSLMNHLIQLENSKRSCYDFVDVGMNFIEVPEVRNGAFYIASLKCPEVVGPNSDFLIHEDEVLNKKDK